MSRVYGYHPLPHTAEEETQLRRGPGRRYLTVSDYRDNFARPICWYCRATLDPKAAPPPHEAHACCGELLCRAKHRAYVKALNTINLAHYEPKRRTA